MRILGIETSCDETAIAIVDGERRVLAHALVSQLEDHAPYGGVVPEIAARSHLHHLRSKLDAVLQESGLTLGDMDGIAATAGPGLIGGVMVGLMFAKALASVERLPLIGVNHLEAHALTARFTDDVQFPFLLVLVSGGHCQMLEVEGVGRYRELGATRDDALGEAFDKTAKMMGLPYPGGPVMERLARQGDPKRFRLPRPMMGTEGCDMSFSGLKTAVRLALAELDPLADKDRADMAASFEAAICDVMRDRLEAALALCHNPNLTACVVAGGVAANQALRKALQQVAARHELPLVVPPIALCTDNAVMVAWAGLERLKLGWTDTVAIEPKARWPLTSLSSGQA